MKKLTALLAFAGMVIACEKAPEFIETVELGCTVPEVTVDYHDGKSDLKILSNGEWTATLDASWACFEGGKSTVSLSGDGVLAVLYDYNRSFSRRADVKIESRGRSIVVTLIQTGLLSDNLEVEDLKVQVPGDGGVQYAKILTSFNNLNISVSYPEGDQQYWISGLRQENNNIIFSAQPNYSDSGNRDARIDLSSEDALGRKYEASIYVSQDYAGHEIDAVSFADLFAMIPGAKSSITITDEKVLGGIVISDNLCGNGGENINISATIQDRKVAARTVYLEDATLGDRGVKILFDTDTDNITRRYDHVSLNLKGLTLTRELNPERYTISGASASSLLSVKGGFEGDVPVKIKRIADLRDNDLYTFVTLKDCEIPIRKGPFVPTDIRYNDLMNKYPMVIRDRNGDVSHLMINTSCTFSRDGRRMPYGSGNISGVVVHETCDQFEWDSEEEASLAFQGIASDYIAGLGQIGDYQIRPISREDIALAEDFSDGFSEMACEFRYYDALYDNLVKNVNGDGVIYSTYPAVADPFTDATVTGRMTLEGGSKNVAAVRDWTHLGPLYRGEIANPSGGNGVEDYYGREAHWSVYTSIATTAILESKNGAAWEVSAWKSSGMYWQVAFSTSGIDASHAPMSVQVGQVNGYGSVVGAPRHWSMEYSTNKSTWTKIADYTVPDFPLPATKRIYQCPAFKYMSFTLPADADVWNKSNVYIRMIPLNNDVGSENAYDGVSGIKSSATSGMNYFAVRYNK